MNEFIANYDENEVPTVTLPDPLIHTDGTRVDTQDDWQNKRRAEILSFFENSVYGKIPDPPKQVIVEERSEAVQVFNNLAIRKEVRVHFSTEEEPYMDLLIYLPKKPDAVALFVGLNFGGNHTLHADPEITLSDRWMRAKSLGVENNRATETSRGSAACRWPVERILARGYGLATVYCGDLDPDFDDGYQNGVHPLFYKDGQTRPAPDESGTIGAWT